MSRPASAARLALIAELLGLSAEAAQHRARFFAKVRERADGCHEWVAARNDGAYGIFTIRKHPLLAHRIALSLHLNRVVTGDVLHRCVGAHWCVNPKHLREGTQADNNRDMVEQGAQVHGVTHGKTPEGRERAQEIRAARLSGEGVRSICERFGVSAPVVFRASRSSSPIPSEVSR